MTNEIQGSAIEATIRQIFKEIFEEHVPGVTFPDLGADTVLLDTGLDSLGFAIVVARLEEELGFDPFSISDQAHYPVTFDQFVKFYKDVAN